jgi:site-specific DNA-methyltransferase (adenine-specific)/modification methylase
LNPEKQKDGALKQMRDVWSLPLVQGRERLRGKDGRALHPTQKPEEMLKRIIIASSNKGDLVLDPFGGSGTTMEACQKLDRSCWAVEISQEFSDIIKKRCFGVQTLSGVSNYEFASFHAQNIRER